MSFMLLLARIFLAAFVLASGPMVFAQAPLPGVPAPAGRTFNEAMLRGKEFLLEKQNLQKGQFPQDFRLGPLQGYLSDSTDEAQAYVAMSEFLTSVLTGDVNAALIAPQWKTLITRLLGDAYQKKLLPKGFRIGRLRWEDASTIYANIALMGEPGSARGQLYMEKSGKGQWLVSDLQIDFTEMTLPPEPRLEPYSPGSYEFLLGL